ncbi:MAG: hypothetical protein A2722_03775 [Candidatus Doudnabacteria bacterium RIFCSPHIGHO2_01_FULL_50_11]|uniref:Methyltransferase type 11 domain-containing protein n=1 Tax=Candidatus Doudnabacteria bacterium RIFCSPHIGHO2_01_FULL_50_11 TaxID=1817828 RepID=A0A1F5PHS2_9BACT|nr:MAG: hypothetical protein A2722_03775 [Candidatus Doudnabacteria bacterium RIFCSPHIGHO2_01_FULL_50_11]
MTREQLIRDFISGKDVLDVGSVGEDSSHSFWQFLRRHAKSLAGIDLRPSDQPGVVAGNMESYQFGRTFDVIVAGDVLIQTDNQGLLLDNAARHLQPDGLLILTLPNAKWPTVFLRPSPFQTGWHDRHTITRLLGRHGFEVVKLDFYPGNRDTMKTVRKSIGFRQSMFIVCRTKHGKESV